MEAEKMGIRKKVIEKVKKLEYRPENTYKRTVDLYQLAMEEVIKEQETISIDVRNWNSAFVKSSTYDQGKQEMIIEFNNGFRYQYEDFSIDLYTRFLESESKGKFFLSEIKKNYTDGTKVKRL